MSCCCSSSDIIEEDKLKDGAVLRNRRFTDCCCIPIFGIFLVVWFVILGFAVKHGDPKRLFMPKNFRQRTCGSSVNDLQDYPDLYIPLPNYYYYGICVKKCPEVGSYVCNNDLEPVLFDNDDPKKTVLAPLNISNKYYEHSVAEFNEGQKALLACNNPTTGCDDDTLRKAKRFAGLLVKIKQFKCFLTIYKSSPLIRRCLPIDLSSENSTLLSIAGESNSTLRTLINNLGISNFFTKGFTAIIETRQSIFICCFTALVVAFLWIILLRWILGPIIYLTMTLIFIVLVAIGVLFIYEARKLDDSRLPGDNGATGHAKAWRAFAYIFFLISAIYLVVCVFLIQRIRIAIVIMKEASKAFSSNPGLLLFPPCVFVFMVGFTIIFGLFAAYIHTVEIKTSEKFAPFIANFENKTIDGGIIGKYLGNQSKNWYDNPVSNISVDNNEYQNKLRYIHLYNIFMYLWVMAVVVMYSFFSMACVVTCWYFSATCGEINAGTRDKETKYGTLLRAIFITLFYHLGTVIFGGLLIAIIQLIRAIALYIEENYLRRWKNSVTARCLICCVNCCLSCIEKLIRTINRSAFVITIIKNKYFCGAACEALGLMVANLLRTGTVMVLTVATCFLIKIFVAFMNTLIGFFLIKSSRLNDKVPESGVFPLFLIFVISYVIASIFMNVYESCIDTVLICFYVDEESFQGKFFPPSLAKILGRFKQIADAHKQYEETLRKNTEESESN